jgi:phosphopantothenoylcysteine decarboxylase/phosphopantothenate--cysteine ligase
MLIRSSQSVCVIGRECSLLLQPGKNTLRVEPEQSSALREVLRSATNSITREELSQRAGEESIDFLVDAGILEEEPNQKNATGKAPQSPPIRHLILGVSGAISATRTPQLIRPLSQICQQLDVVLTPSAAKLVQPQVLEYVGASVWLDAFSPRGEVNVPHMYLASSAEIILIYPASAHTIFKLANGSCSDLLSLVCAATQAPVVLAPAMNPAMWDNPAIQRNIQTLIKDGLFVIEPSSGYEVSEKKEARLGFGGLGSGIDMLIPTLLEIIALHKERGPSNKLDSISGKSDSLQPDLL